MSVTTTKRKESYTLTSSGQTLSVPFYFLEDDDLRVIKTTSAGVITTLALSSDYTVSGAGDPTGGSITLTGGESGDKITIVRDPDSKQETTYAPNDRFPAAVHETALDKLTMLAQTALEWLGRTLYFPENETKDGEVTLSSRKNKLLGFDTNGDPTFHEIGAGIVVTGEYLEYNTVTALEADSDIGNYSNEQTIVLKGYYAAADFGSPIMLRIEETKGGIKSFTLNDGRYANLYTGGYANVKWFGAKGDGVQDETGIIRAAVSGVHTGPGTVYFPAGTYKVTDRISSSGMANVSFIGEPGSSIIDAEDFDTYGDDSDLYDDYTGDGTRTEFPFTFTADSTSDVVVRVDGVIKTLSTDYTISWDTGDDGPPGTGDVTFVSAPSGGAEIRIFDSYQKVTFWVHGVQVPDAAMVTSAVDEGSDKLVVSSVDTFGIGDMLFLHSKDAFHKDRDPPYKKEEWVVIKSIDSGTKTLTLRDPTYYSYTLPALNDDKAKLDLISTPAANIVFRGLTVKQSGTRAVRIQYFKDSKIENCRVEGGEAGLWLSSGMRGDIIGCTAEGCNENSRGYAFYFTSVQGGRAVRCYGVNNRHSFEAANSSKEIIIDKCIIHEDTSFGISSHGGTDGITVTNCRIYGAADGIYLRGTNNRVANNWGRRLGRAPGGGVPAPGTSNVSGFCIQIGEGTVSSWDTIISGINLVCTGNVFEDCWRGIQINGPADNARITGNVLKDCIYDDSTSTGGIWLKRGGKNITVNDNSINGTKKWGIVIQGRSDATDPHFPIDDITVQGNFINGTLQSDGTTKLAEGIRISSDFFEPKVIKNVKVLNNHITGCNLGISHGEDNQIDTILLQGNTFKDNVKDISIVATVFMHGLCRSINNSLTATDNRRAGEYILTTGDGTTGNKGFVFGPDGAGGRTKGIRLFLSEEKPRVFAFTEGNFRAYVESFTTTTRTKIIDLVTYSITMYLDVNIKVLQLGTDGSGHTIWEDAADGTTVHVLIR